jgi:CRISPR-associated endonuclease Cas1
MVNLHIKSKGTKLEVINKTLKIYQQNEEESTYDIAYINQMNVYTDVFINSSVIKALYDAGVEIVFCRENGSHICSTYGPMYGMRANMSFKQLFIATKNEGEAIIEWILNRKYIRRIQLLDRFIYYNKVSIRTRTSIESIKLSIDLYRKEQKLQKCEAILDKKYYQIINSVVSSDYQFIRSRRRQNSSLGNSILNYLYGIMYQKTESILLKNKLDPYIGFNHGMSRGKKAFLFDVVEMHRPFYEEIFLKIAIENVILANQTYELSANDRKICSQMANNPKEYGFSFEYGLKDSDIKNLVSLIKKTYNASISNKL